MRTIFRDTFAPHLDKLESVAASERRSPDFDAEDSRRRDRLVGWAFRLLETRGLAAKVDDNARTAMPAYGMSDADIGETAAVLATMKRQNLAAERPQRLSDIVRRARGEPTPLNLTLAQEARWRSIAEANFQTVRRSDGVRAAAARPGAASGERPGAQSRRLPDCRPRRKAHRAKRLTRFVGRQIAAPGPPDLPPVGELLSEQNVVDPAALAQRHFAELAELLSEIAIACGKSPQDAGRSLADLQLIGASKPPPSAASRRGR